MVWSNQIARKFRMLDVQLLAAPLDVAVCEKFVACREAGAVVSFVGSVRKMTAGKNVLRLEFEAYGPMAVREMEKIGQAAVEQFGALRVSFHHRTGVLEVGEVAVAVAVSARHRAEAFSACQFCIDTLKQTVPIWKKEVFGDGEIWVAAHP